MKSFRIILAAFSISLLTAGANGQAFVGGSFGLRLNGGKFDNGTQTSDRPSELNLNLSPVFGKFISEKVALGIELDLGYSRESDNAAIEEIDLGSSFGVSPFLRLYAPLAGKLSVFGQGNLGFFYTSTKNKNGSTTTDGPKSTQLSFNIFPGLEYDLTEKLSLETSINVLNFGYSLNTSKSGNSTTTTSNFNLGGGIDNIVNVGNIRIGAIYKF